MCGWGAFGSIFEHLEHFGEYFLGVFKESVEGENNFLRVGMRSRRILTHFGVFLRLAALLTFSVCRSAFLRLERVSGARHALNRSGEFWAVLGIADFRSVSAS